MYAAVEAYYEGYEEVLRVQKDGGARQPTLVMKRTMTGKYLHLMTGAIQPSRYKVTGASRIDGYSVGSQTPTEIPITGCENETGIKVLDKRTGKEVTRGTTGLRVREVVAVEGQDGRWRIDRIVRDEYFKPADWETRSCMAGTERPQS
jgi:hypothetical protein